MVKTQNFVRGASNKHQNRNQNNRAITNNRNAVKTKSVTQKANNPKILALEYNSKKLCNNNCGDAKQNKIQKSRDTPALDKAKNELDNPLCNKISDDQFSIEIDGEDIVEHEFIYSGNSGSSKAKIGVVNKKGSIY